MCNGYAAGKCQFEGILEVYRARLVVTMGSIQFMRAW